MRLEQPPAVCLLGQHKNDEVVLAAVLESHPLQLVFVPLAEHQDYQTPWMDRNILHVGLDEEAWQHFSHPC
jgi:hypothetical protein